MNTIEPPAEGGPITLTQWEGIKFGISAQVYRRAPGVNHSNAKEIDLSPLHYLQATTAAEEEPTDAQVIGTILHSAILESDFSGFVVKPKDMTFQTKEGKAWRDAQTKQIITQDVAKNIAGAVVSVKNHELASGILYRSKGNNEVSCWKIHAATGLLIKGRADRVATDNQERTIIADVKSVERGHATPGAFAREIKKWSYHTQSDWYLELFGATHFVFIVVEKEAPFDVLCRYIGPKSLRKARELNERRLAKIKECAESGKWPGVSDQLQEIEMPDWALKDEL